MFNELRNNFIKKTDDGTIHYIDGWRTSSKNEEGIVIAEIKVTNNNLISVAYRNPNHKNNKQITRFINDTINKILTSKKMNTVI